MTGGGIQLDAQRIPISLAGPDAAEAADLLNGAGLNAAVVGEEIGAAAALKMLRSVVIKGMEGLWVEALLAARERGVVEPLLAMIEETLDRYSGRDFATMLVTTDVGHAGRRQVEVRMSRDTVAGNWCPPLLSDGIVAVTNRMRGVAAAGAGAPAWCPPLTPRWRSSDAGDPRSAGSAARGLPLQLGGDQPGRSPGHRRPWTTTTPASSASSVGVPGDRAGGGRGDEPEQERTEGGAGADPAPRDRGGAGGDAGRIRRPRRWTVRPTPSRCSSR